MITSKTEITSCIDWISVTRPVSAYPEDWNSAKKELPRGMHGYDTAIKYLDGRIELCSSTRSDMGVHTIVSGEAITRICEMNGIDSFDVMVALGDCGHSRLDIALDIKHGCLDIRKLWDMLEQDNVETQVKDYLYLKGAKGNGETLYIGGAKSKKRLRVYDKRAESGANYEWTRLELQYRHKSAKRAARTLLNADRAYSEIAKMIVNFIDFNSYGDWVVALGTESVGLGKPEPSISNRADWLLGTAASALAAEMVEGRDCSDFLDRFINETMRKYSQKKAKYHK